MKRRNAFPFLTLPENAVQFGGWMIGDPGQPLHPAQDILEGWDYERDLEVSAAIEVDFDTAAKALGIADSDLDLTLVLRCGTGSGTLPRRSDLLATERMDASAHEVVLSSLISAHGLSGRIRLELGILLGRVPSVSRTGGLSPRTQGARLWSVARDILIEDGGDSRFPIELVSFVACFPGTPQVHSPWYLDWKLGSIHADFGGSVRLYVNSDIPELADRFVSGDPLTLQAMLADVMSQMVGSIVASPDAEDMLQETAEGTVGQQLLTWMDLAFPGQSPKSIASMAEHLPGRFRAALLSASDIGDAA